MHADPDADRTMITRTAPAPVSVIVHALLLREAGAAPQRIALREAPVTIGRGPANAVVLASPEISRQHCSVALSGDGAIVTDLNSTNGSFVDGVPVQGTAILHRGARLAVGPFTLTYYCGSATDLDAAEEAERDQARAVRYIQALLPARLPRGPVRADWLFAPSAQLGGDAFGYRWIGDERFAAFLLDVSGHGVGSSLLAASAANILRAPSLGADPTDPAAVLAAVNAAFQMEDQDDQFFSLWYGVYDRRARRLRYATAGHHPAILVRTGAVERLATRGPAIGMAPAYGWQAAETDVPAGARLHLFSDGAFEVLKADERAGSVEDLVALLQAGCSAPAALFEGIREMTGRRPFDDDVSLLTFEFSEDAS